MNNLDERRTFQIIINYIDQL